MPNQAPWASPSHIWCYSQIPRQNAPPWPWVTWPPPEITWSSCDDHATMSHLISRPSSQWTWDLKVPTLFLSNIFSFYGMLFFLITLQCLYVSMFLILTWRPIVCTPVPCSHPCLLHPHADSHHSYRCLLDSVPIALLVPVTLCSISYNWFPDFIVFLQFDYHKSYPSGILPWGTLSFYPAHSMRSLTLGCSSTTQFIT